MAAVESAQPTKTVLLADNSTALLESRTALLQRAGFNVFTAASPSAAREIFEREQLDIAIIDLRLTDDNDDRDVSGFGLARELGQSIPTILQTEYQIPESIRFEWQAEKDRGSKLAEIVLKRDGTKRLVELVRDLIT